MPQLLKIQLPKIYPITDIGISGLSHAEQVRRLIDGGAEFIQLREKRMAAGAFYEDALSAIEIAHKSGVCAIINDRVDIALALKADGVHLGQDDLPPGEARKILGPEAIIGFSTHSVEQALAAIQLPVDYIAIGPIFATATKENPDAVVGIDGLRAVGEAVGELPLVAIGGIGSENFRAVLDAGADSIALISGILADPGRITERVAKFSAV